MPLSFHRRCGQLVTLSSDAHTAVRSHAAQEFNHGLVLSAQPLQDNQMFEVRIDRKVQSWSGSIEVGVTTCDPASLDTTLPSSATELRHGSWIMSGNSILRDGRSVHENYGTDLDNLDEMDRVGVLRTGQGDLLFFVNGVSQSVAASNIPERVFAVVDMYGKCAQVTLMDEDGSAQEARIASNDLSNEATAAAASHNHVNLINTNSPFNNLTNSNIAAMSSATSAAANAAVAATSSSSSGAGAAARGASSASAASPSAKVAANAANASAASASASSNKLRFHERKGVLIKLSNNHRTAERRRPFDEFNNGIVMTHRPLRDNELFEIRIDRLVDKWSGSIEVGITTHNPNTLEFPATMTNQRSGTMMMSGCGILTNGRGTRREYGEFNLDELSEGDRIGMTRKTNGNLHFYINGLDQGVAATKVPQQMWGVVDLYGMTVKVTIVDRDERDEQNLITRRNVAAAAAANAASASASSGRRQQLHLSTGPADLLAVGSSSAGAATAGAAAAADHRLLFHPNCGSHAAVLNGGQTAHRPNASDDFNFGVVITNRPLRANEVFEVRLDKMVSKWAGSIEIGVTTHSPNDLEFPSTMTNIRSGTWMMTGNGVMHNGSTVIDDYGLNLDKLKVGDRVAVVRKDDGTVHFFVNSDDQGPAARNVPDCVYGVIDLYGQAAQATLLDLGEYARSPAASDRDSDVTTIYSQLDTTELRFHHLHGRNARISNNGITASRPNALGEFNDAIVISNRPLKDDEPFEIVIERMVERWSGAIEAGITLIRAEDLEFPNTMTDIDYDTWMLSGSAVMQDGQTVRNGYQCDLDTLTVGSRLGMVRRADGSLHYTINGEDKGVACRNIPPGVYAVIDLYGQCAQVSLVQQHEGAAAQEGGTAATSATPVVVNSPASSSQALMESSHVSLLPCSEVAHRFHGVCSRGLEVKNNGQTCARASSAALGSSAGLPGGLVFASSWLEGDDAFEIRIDSVDSRWAGSLKLGVTTAAQTLPETSQAVRNSMYELASSKAGSTYWLEDAVVRHNGRVIRTNYGYSLDRLSNGDKVGLRRSADGSLRFLVNGDDFGPVGGPASLPRRVLPVVELCGSTTSVTVTSSSHQVLPSPSQDPPQFATAATSATLQDSLEAVLEENEDERASSPPPPLEFHDNRGRNVRLRPGKRSARRTESYNQGVLLTQRPLQRNEVFHVRVDRLNAHWSSSLMVGVLGHSPDKLHLPVTALGLKKDAYVVCGDGLFQNGLRVPQQQQQQHQGANLDRLRAGHTVGVSVDDRNQLRLHVNGVDQGAVFRNLSASTPYYGLVDMYGQCEELSIGGAGDEERGEDALKLKGGKVVAPAPPVSPPVASYNVLEKTFCALTVSGGGVGGFVRNCEYLALCRRFLRSLGLPASFFAEQQQQQQSAATCYCLSCTHARGDAAYVKKGDPVRDFATPVGWCRFAVRLPAAAASAREDWHTAFHGTRPQWVRRVLDNGDLTPPGELGLERHKSSKPKLKEDDSSDAPQLLFSPTLTYLSRHASLCPATPFKDKIGRGQRGAPSAPVYQARLALQVEVHPGSYKVGPPSVGSQQTPPDPHFKLEETEWLTKERGNTLVSALLVRLD